MHHYRVAVITAFFLIGSALSGVASAHELPDQASDRATTHGPDGKALDRRRVAPAAPYDVSTYASWSATQWDGARHTTDQPDLTSLPTLHAIYMYPSDAPDRFGKFAAMIQADARDASRLLSADGSNADGQSYGYGLRWDERLGTGGTNYIDTTVIRSSQRSRKLGGSNQFSLVGTELRNRGFTNPNKKYLVWLDAASRYCGQAQLYYDTVRSNANLNERSLYGIVYRPYSTTDPNGGFCRGRVAMHEIGHTLGAVQSVAPNNSDGAHCDDSAEDVMCYLTNNPPDTGDAVFDSGQNDYWDPEAAGLTGKLSWWTVNLSRFLCPPDPLVSPRQPDCTKSNTPTY